MKLLYRLTPLLLSMLLIGCAQNPAQTTPAASTHTLAPAGAGFTVNMPGKVEEKRGADGDHRYSAVVNDVNYFAAYTDFGRQKHLTPAQLSMVLDGASRSVASHGMKLLAVKKISVDGHEARELTIRAQDGHLVRIRMTLVHGRLIMVSAETKGQQTDTPEITRFLESFHITMH